MEVGSGQLETFTKPITPVENSRHQNQRQKALARLDAEVVDEPIAGLICAFNELPFCFTLQCCYGHFLYDGRDNPHNLDPLPVSKTIGSVTYRLAYIAFCVENSASGRMLCKGFKEIPAIDPENIQFGCATWFWERQVNSYVLQVEPSRFRQADKMVLAYDEALKIEETRQTFFERLNELVAIRG